MTWLAPGIERVRKPLEIGDWIELDLVAQADRSECLERQRSVVDELGIEAGGACLIGFALDGSEVASASSANV